MVNHPAEPTTEQASDGQDPTYRTAEVSQFDPTPWYKQTAAIIRGRIASGDYPAGQALPAVRALAEELGTSSGPVNAAIALLVSEGLLERNNRRPALVRAPRQREWVTLHAGDIVDARMPTPRERAAENIGPGVPVVVVGRQVLPADRISLQVGRAARTRRTQAGS